MTMKPFNILLLAASTELCALPAPAADVTPERLANPDREPQSWVMNHRSYDAQRLCSGHKSHQQ